VNCTLTRFYHTLGTAGLFEAGTLRLHTLEPAWANNDAGVSCVPEGPYDLIPWNSPRHPNTYALDNVALGVTWDGRQGTRSACLLHAGNFAQDSEGCILFGLTDAPMMNPRTGEITLAIESSAAAIQQLIAALGIGVHGHTLTISEAGTP
jgi:hypothetical protein